MKMNSFDWVALVLLAIGGINWGLIGLFEFNLLAELFGELSALSRLIYILVGISALYLVASMSTHASHHETAGQHN